MDEGTQFNSAIRSSRGGVPWTGNYRDLSALVRRLCTLAECGRITQAGHWAALRRDGDLALLAWLRPDPEDVDEFDRAQLATVLQACRAAASLSAAG
ncbi:hypothetical protein K6L44_15680 [Gluconacetobacter entanii]|uniref:hypothetical protein n=1 Tax=Gluconacetobacter entanii TaxID=108528 RepID=UPI001C934E12|nr:hypothetical protein [Gluconacetobacter entanii]MBY4641397.1 hypothetical protein [Gluconacetobacter entanii]MCW4579073.1 hypothetical protein [Gluconacetobacter entanii]MCW4582477.1 hypothetical protein [Gluconacetobacter entanii]MCW4585861.1 hypothetical protein [Gluconacetobacter entanii]